MSDATPAKRPCGSCPYRKDTPSGIWAQEHYDLLPEFDKPTWEQPVGVFYCHQQNGRLCAGWVACHDMDHSMGLRVAASIGMLDTEDVEACWAYTTDVPIFESGAAAAEHGKADLHDPGEAAQRAVDKLLRAPAPMEPRRLA